MQVYCTSSQHSHNRGAFAGDLKGSIMTMNLKFKLYFRISEITLAQYFSILILRMASPCLKRAFISSESDCSGSIAKRPELQRNSPAHSPNGEWSKPKLDLHSSQSGTNAFSILPQAGSQFAYADVSQGIDATMLDSPVNNLQPPNHKNLLSANPRRDVEAPILSPQAEREPDLQVSEMCFGMV